MIHLAGFGGTQGAGQRPALLVVDMSLGFTDRESPLVCDLDSVVAAIGELLTAAREADIPIVYTTVSYSEAEQATAKAFIEKVPALLTLAAGTRWVEIDPRIAPLPREPLLSKLFASAFFGTSMASLLTSHACDSVIVTGASTSGCVRTTVVDALQHGYRVVVPREAVGDRDPAAHEQALFDIDAKYGDVVPVAQVVASLRARSKAEGVP
jgi:maleamate amidohydrolase